jgi:hypothetical protein
MAGVPVGETVVLDVAQLEALLATTFTIGLVVGRGKDTVALARLHRIGRDRPNLRAPDRAELLAPRQLP